MSKRVELRKAKKKKKPKPSKTKERDKLKKGQAGVSTFTSPGSLQIRATADTAETKYEAERSPPRFQKMSLKAWQPKDVAARLEEGKHPTRGAPSTEKRFGGPKASHMNITTSLRLYGGYGPSGHKQTFILEPPNRNRMLPSPDGPKKPFKGFEGTPNTAETEYETISAPERKP